MASEPRTTGLTYEALWRFPDDGLRREIIDGELFVTPPPGIPHQDAVANLLGALWTYERTHGGRVYSGPAGVFLSETSLVEPDVIFIRADHLDKVEEAFVRGAPDLVVEVSSPSTQAVDLGRKLDLYGRFGVPEYWFVDLKEEVVRVFRLQDRRFGEPLVFRRGEAIQSSALPGFGISADEALGDRG